MMISLLSLSLFFQEERRGVLKGVIPSVLISAAAHCGKHYWTSSTTRQQAHGQQGLVTYMLPVEASVIRIRIFDQPKVCLIA